MSPTPSTHTQRRVHSGPQQESIGWAPIIGYLVYDVTWTLLRSVSIFVLYWLASHEESRDAQIVYLLVSIQILQLDASL